MFFYRLESGKSPIFATTSYLASEEKEMEFLRKLCEIIVIFLMPRGYSLLPMKSLLSEVLSYKSIQETFLIFYKKIFNCFQHLC